MNIKDIEALSKTIGATVKNAIASSSAALKKEFETEIENLKSQIADLKTENSELKSKTLATVELKVDVVETKKELDALEKRVIGLVDSISEIPELDTKAIIDSLEETIAAKFKHFEKSVELPKDGKSVTLDDVAPIISKSVSEFEERIEKSLQTVNAAVEVLNTIKIPEDGKSVTIEDLKPVIDDAVSIIELKAVEFLEAVKVPEDGKSVTVADVQPLLDAALSEIKNEAMTYVKSVELPKDGLDGLNGADGKDGSSVTIEDVTPLIKNYAEELKKEIPSESFIEELVTKAVSKIEIPKDGKDGVDGINGIDGANGKDGKDAVAIEILPTIDMSKSYPRGTFATYKKGLWRSFETTFELRGWECIVSGLDEVEVVKTGENNFEFVVKDSVGNEFKKDFRLPLMVYKNIYKDGESYSEGNIVTYAGSTWHSNIDENKSKPGTNSDWTLCVRKGRDYREPVKTEKASSRVKIK